MIPCVNGWTTEFAGKVILGWCLGALMGGLCYGAEPAGPYAELYESFRDRVAHGLTAKLYVGVRPHGAGKDDCYVPSGFQGLTDGVHDCYCEKGRAVLRLRTTPAAVTDGGQSPPAPLTTATGVPAAAGSYSVPGVAARPFVRVPASPYMPGTSAPTAAGVSTSSPATTVTAPTRIGVRIVEPRGDISGCST